MKKVYGLIGVGMVIGVFLFVQLNIGYATNGTITLYGKVTNETNASLKGLKISLSSSSVDKRNIPEMRTDENGEYRFEGLLPGKYSINVRNGDKPEAIHIIPDKYACMNPETSPRIYKIIELKETDTLVEVNFQLVLGVKVTGNITYEDGSAAEHIGVRAKNGWGTNVGSKADGSYSLKGLLVENNTVTLEFDHDQISVSGWHAISYTLTIPASPGASVTGNIQIRKIDQTKISLKGSVYVEGVLYDPQNKDFLEEKKFPPNVMPVCLAIKKLDGTYSYGLFLGDGNNGKYELYNISPGSYKCKAIYLYATRRPPDFPPYRQGPIRGETDIEIPANGVVTVDINIVLTPTERIEFIKQ